MRLHLFPAREATPNQIAISGAGPYGEVPGDRSERGWRQVSSNGLRGVPSWTLEAMRTHSVAAYRTNPMARAIIDTYTAFCVGDSGLTLHCTNDAVKAVAEEMWNDPRNRLDEQDLALNTHLLLGETAWEMLVYEGSGRTRRSVIDPSRVSNVDLLNGNPLWPDKLHVRQGAGLEDTVLQIVGVDDFTDLRTGQVMWWPGFRALDTDMRGAPFLMPIIDWLDSYDLVINNLVDRTALARWINIDVAIKGGPNAQDKVDKYIAEHGSSMPQSGTMHVHTDDVTIQAITPQVGSYEDANTSKTILTSVAAGGGLAKTWLAEPEDANRATSVTMAEPVRRRINRVQNSWLKNQTELVRFAIDRAVAAGRLPLNVEVSGADGSSQQKMRASMAVKITGPEVAAADAQITAEVLVNLSKALDTMVKRGILSPEAAHFAAKKGWEDYCGIPWMPELDKADGSRKDDLAEQIDKTQTAEGRRHLRRLP